MKQSEIQKRVSGWQAKTFTCQSLEGMIKHLKKEVDELDGTGYWCDECREWVLLEHVMIDGAEAVHIAQDGEAHSVRGKHWSEELADCAILLFGLAARVGKDLLTEVAAKMDINESREWGEPDERTTDELLKKEIHRVEEVRDIYKRIPTGGFGYVMLTIELEYAYNALEGGDKGDKKRAIERLERCE